MHDTQGKVSPLKRPSRRPARLFIIDDHPIVRAGLAQMIQEESELVICGQAATSDQTLKVLPAAHADLVILDISLKGTSGLDLIKRIKTLWPRMRVLVLSMHDESIYAERALRAGASGYVMKEEATDKLVNAIHRVLQGHTYISTEMTERLLNRFTNPRKLASRTPMDLLSNRELEVFKLIGSGFRPRNIALKLGLSVKTVEAYLDHIKQKLDLNYSEEVLRHAILWSRSPQSKP
jgi:DNA-binding NarL/FixJ family response regulator